MIDKKLKEGVNIDPKDISALLLGGVINILNQHDALDKLEECIKAHDHKNITNTLRIEALENWVMKQHDTIEILNVKLSMMDVNCAIVKESNALQALDKRILSLEVDSRSVNTLKHTENSVEKKPKFKPMKCS